MALASLLPFQGPKKSRFSGPTPSNPPRNDVAPLKIIIIYVPSHKNNKYINSYIWSRFKIIRIRSLVSDEQKSEKFYSKNI